MGAFWYNSSSLALFKDLNHETSRDIWWFVRTFGDGHDRVPCTFEHGIADYSGKHRAGNDVSLRRKCSFGRRTFYRFGGVLQPLEKRGKAKRSGRRLLLLSVSLPSFKKTGLIKQPVFCWLDIDGRGKLSMR